MVDHLGKRVNVSEGLERNTREGLYAEGGGDLEQGGCKGNEQMGAIED